MAAVTLFALYVTKLHTLVSYLAQRVCLREIIPLDRCLNIYLPVDIAVRNMLRVWSRIKSINLSRSIKKYENENISMTLSASEKRLTCDAKSTAALKLINKILFDFAQLPSPNLWYKIPTNFILS